MCSLADCEMLVSHSPPVFSHSPPSAAFLADYPGFRFGADSRFRPQPQQQPQQQRSGRPATLSLWTGGPSAHPPIRPCLVVRPGEQAPPPPPASLDPVSPTRLKKRVVFADDRGIPLTEVRVMREPSGVPPLWSLKFLSEVTGGASADPGAKEDCWEILFAQPASNYVEFRKKLDTNKVSLENVIVKEAEELIVGTVKVSNLDFHKEVFVRVSWDGWLSHEDVACDYVPQSLQSTAAAAYVLYDTFSFGVALRPDAARAEFCVRFRCRGVDHWDSNAGRNYVIVKKAQQRSAPVAVEDDVQVGRRRTQADVKRALRQTYSDAQGDAKLDSWSEFASWTHLENSRPHW